MPEQIYPGESFSNGQQVDAYRLNNHVGGARLLPGAITEQDMLTATATVSPGDQLAIVDTSEGTLRKVTVAELLNTGTSGKIETVTSRTIEGYPEEDLKFHPYQGQIYSGGYVSTGQYVTITANLHGLNPGNVIQVTNVVSGDSAIVGIYMIISASTNTFQYRLRETRSATTGTVLWRKTASVFVSTGNLSVGGSAYVYGSAEIAGSGYILGDLKVVGNLTYQGNKTPLTLGEQPRVYVKNGTTAVNQGVEFTVYTSPTLTIPTDETWVYEIVLNTRSSYVTGSTRPDVNALCFTVYNNATSIFQQYGDCSPYGAHTGTWTYAKTLTSTDNGFILKVNFLSLVTLRDPVSWQIKLTKTKTTQISDASSCI